MLKSIFTQPILTLLISFLLSSFAHGNQAEEYCSPIIVATDIQGADIDSYDINKDGILDLLVSDPSSPPDGKFFWVCGETGEIIAVHQDTQLFLFDIKAVDFDNDGDPDVAAAFTIQEGSQNAYLAIYEMVDGSPIRYKRHQLKMNGGIIAEMAILDIDDDGDADIASVSQTGQVAIYQNISDSSAQGKFIFSQVILDANYFSGFSIDTTDMDGDNKIDIIVSGAVNGDINLYTNRSSADGLQFTESVLVNVGSRAQAIRSGDVDEDGNIDLVVLKGSLVQVYLNNINSFELAWSSATNGSPVNMALAGLGKGGALDIVVADILPGTTPAESRGIYTYKNLSEPGRADFLLEFPPFVQSGFGNVYALDTNSNGVVDIIATSTTFPGTHILKARSECSGDCDLSNSVDFRDLVCQLFLFGSSDCNSDCDRSGIVDFSDLVCTLFNYGCSVE